MNDLSNSPKRAFSKRSQTKQPSYKVIFTVLKPQKRLQTIEEQPKKQVKLGGSLKYTKKSTSRDNNTAKVSIEKYQSCNPNIFKHVKSLSGSINQSRAEANRNDMKINLKPLNDREQQTLKTEEVATNRILYHSERKFDENTNQIFGITTRCMQIEDIIMNAPYFQCKGRENNQKSSKVIKLKKHEK